MRVGLPIWSVLIRTKDFTKKCVINLKCFFLIDYKTFLIKGPFDENKIAYLWTANFFSVFMVRQFLSLFYGLQA
jgi:hypothetical protein